MTEGDSCEDKRECSPGEMTPTNEVATHEFKLKIAWPELRESEEGEYHQGSMSVADLNSGFTREESVSSEETLCQGETEMEPTADENRE